jgi:LPXTG-motif cell wall-anchored protein
MQLPRVRRPVLVSTALALAATGVLAGSVQAATSPPAVSLPSSPGSHKVTFHGTAPFNNGQANLLIDDVTGACDPNNGMGAQFRDATDVTVKVPAKVNPKYDVLIRFQIDWNSVTPEPTEDLRLDLFGPDGKLVASSDSSQEQEGINVTAPVGGKYKMVVCAFQDGPDGQPYTGSVTASLLRPPPKHLASGTTAPRYAQYLAPKGKSDDAGEPSIGNNWKSGNTLFTSYTHEYAVHFKDNSGHSSWELVNDDPIDPANEISLDPIGFTDSQLGRTFVSQLLFVCSGMSYSDDDFKTQAIPSEGCGTGINGFDHQTVGSGPYPKGGLAQPIDPSYPHAVYYCSQAQALVLGGATCARSDTGGEIFGPPVEIFGGACSGLHGHVRIAPDGTVYVPNANCKGKQGVAVSTDAGMTWAVRSIPGSHAGQSDPSVSAGKDGTIYYGYADGTGRPMVAVSRDRGKTWSSLTDAGGNFGIRNTEFSEVMAGDGDRAAFGFLGTTTRGSTQATSFGKNAAGTKFTGATWHMYVATTYDRGAHWTTVDANPNDPVQRGCIWNSGGSVPCRNLLDFNDITVTKTGKVEVAFADGCVGPAIDPKANCIASSAVAANTLTQHGGVIRQISGKGLFAAYDPKGGSSGVAGGSGGSGGGGGSGSGASGSLADTGSSSWLPVSGLALLALAGVGVLRRRRHTAS